MGSLSERKTEQTTNVCTVHKITISIMFTYNCFLCFIPLIKYCKGVNQSRVLHLIRDENSYHLRVSRSLIWFVHFIIQILLHDWRMLSNIPCIHPWLSLPGLLGPSRQHFTAWWNRSKAHRRLSDNEIEMSVKVKPGSMSVGWQVGEDLGKVAGRELPVASGNSSTE